MNLKLAIASLCTDRTCQVRFLDGGQTETPYSEPVRRHTITICTGDLVAVDCETDPPRVVYRLVLATVLGVEGEQVFAATPCGNQQLTRADGLEAPIGVGTRIFCDRGQVRAVSQGGHAANPERLRTSLFQEIRALYQRMEG